MIHESVILPDIVPAASLLEPGDELPDECLLGVVLHVWRSGVAQEGVVLEGADAAAVHLVHLE